MKKFLFVLLATVLTLVSCGENLTTDDDTTTPIPITFNLTANHPEATKAVKTDWEDGDVIFVFFNKVFAPKHLKMSFNGSKWTCVEMNGNTPDPGCLELSNGNTGQMTAVFLPFGSDATVSESGEGGTSFTFSKKDYTYYLTAKLSYQVINNQISGSFQMQIPDGYVQFFIDDASATHGGYTLATDAVIPVGVASIDRDGNIVEMTKNAGDDMVGYAYGSGDNKGYLFSGKMVSSYSYKGYYFAKTKVADKTRCDYFVTGKKLESHMSVKLPVNSSEYRTFANGEGEQNAEGKWIPVGKDIYVDLMRKNTEDSYIIIGGRSWATCNYGQSVPEAYGSLYRFCDITEPKTSLPAPYLFDFLTNKDPDQSYFSYTKVTVHGQIGYVIQADRGFIFLPASASSICEYWSSEERDNATNAWYCSFAGNRGDCMGYKSSTDINSVCAVRLVK